MRSLPTCSWLLRVAPCCGWGALVIACGGESLEVPAPVSAPAPVVAAGPVGLQVGADGRVLPRSGAAPPEAWQCGRGGQVEAIVSQACFVQVPAARFWMGAQASDPAGRGYDPKAEPHEGPVHEVEVAGFWVQRQEVSAALYAACLEAGWCRADEVSQGGGFDALGDPSRASWPVNGVSWQGAVRLCDWLGGRLPTEAEWELAARGTDGRRFPWGSQVACGMGGVNSDRQAPDHDEACAAEGPRPAHEPRLRSPYGLVGMAGNVWEWVDDWYAADAYGEHPARPVEGDRKVQRGGGWLSGWASELRSAARGAVPPDQKLQDVGLRCAWPGG
jgi:formylglycine-generating enzyme required for sulfatase activity